MFKHLSLNKKRIKVKSKNLSIFAKYLLILIYKVIPGNALTNRREVSIGRIAYSIKKKGLIYEKNIIFNLDVFAMFTWSECVNGVKFCLT